MPALGGEAVIVEIRRDRRGGGRAGVTWFSGHPRSRWRREGGRVFNLSAARYRRLATTVDAAIARARTPPTHDSQGNEVGFICMDGPGYLTERVRGGEAVSLTGWCPYTEDEEHPNVEIAAAVMRLACRRIGDRLDAESRLARRCASARRAG